MQFENNVLKARQIKAARALLDWSQDDLAEASDLSVATIRKIELGEISPRLSTNEAIRAAFENNGLEFLDPDGVRHRPEGIILYHGKQGLLDFFDDVYQCCLRKGGDIIQVSASETPFSNLLGDYDKTHIERMSAIKDRFSFRCILTENLDDLCYAGYCKYRTISKAYVDSVPFYVYDNKYAIIVFTGDTSAKITVIESRVVADAFRRQFQSMWEKATDVQLKSPNQINRAIT